MVFTDEAEFQSTVEAFLASPSGIKYSSKVILQEDGTIRAAAIQAEYSGAINGEASEQVLPARSKRKPVMALAEFPLGQNPFTQTSIFSRSNPDGVFLSR